MRKNWPTTTPNAAPSLQRTALSAAVCFVGFSFAGHWLELTASAVLWLTTGTGYDAKVTNNATQPYMVYGAGALVCVYVLRPFYLRHRLHPVVLYLTSFFSAALLEFVGHQIIVARFGYNPFWDYRDSPLNFLGAVCLSNTAAFGLVATVFIMTVCPRLERWAGRQSTPKLRTMSVLLVGAFFLGLLAPQPVVLAYGMVAVLAAGLAAFAFPQAWGPATMAARSTTHQFDHLGVGSRRLTWRFGTPAFQNPPKYSGSMVSRLR